MQSPRRERLYKIIAKAGRADRLAPVVLLMGLSVWLWPMGLGGRMPTGGDVTQFSLGLMASLSEAIRSGRLPLWNDLWGYGFPGLAESQMGVFYPPHLLLYGLLSVEAAYTASLVLHTFWGGLGAYWASRRFGTSPGGSALAGFAWSASGFFVIHLPHQWGYTTGSWMPWAWGLARALASGQVTRRTPFLLALVLTLQVLPGHFQLAFTTQLGVAIVCLWAVAEGLGKPPPDRQDLTRNAFRVAVAMAAVIPLAAMQLWPTYRLSLLAGPRDYEYLSGFAATPVHLVNYVAPGLFHGSPLWRPLAWDPFHTSPEEHLAYVGLVPLFLAIGAMIRGFRRDPGVRVLTVLVLVTLLLSLGPYVPGFSLWSRLPGFSFFRAPARWSLATGLALSLLAGKGFDRLPDLPRPGLTIVRFAALAALAPLLVVIGFELALASTERPGWPALASGFNRALRFLPWIGDPDFRSLMATARRPQGDLRVRTGLARQGVRPVPAQGLRLDEQRFRIYAYELGGTGMLLVTLVALAPFGRHRPFFRAALVALTFVDLIGLSRRRVVGLEPIRPLSEQSRVLGKLVGASRGTRVASAALNNLPMVAGASPISPYRTLDLPTLVALTRLTMELPGRPGTDPGLIAALRATGTGVQVFDPLETAQLWTESTGRGPLSLSPREGVPEGRVKVSGSAEATVMSTRGAVVSGQESRETIRDPVLAGWLYGAPWVAENGPRASTFTLWHPEPGGARAWLVPLTSGRIASILKSSAGDPGDVLALLDHALPLQIRSPRPERLELDVRAEGPAVVIVSQLAHPQWRAHWSGQGGVNAAPIARVFGGRRPWEGAWQAVEVPGPGAWTLGMGYDDRDVRTGLAVSAAAWASGLAAYFWSGRGPNSGRRRRQ